MAAPFANPVVLRTGSEDPGAPLVVLLHGRGATERDIIGVAAAMPNTAACVAVRGPIPEGTGFAWFANRGPGRPLADSLADTTAWFTTWLESTVTTQRRVILAGFSGGAAFAGALILGNPERYSGAAILFGTLPFDAGIPIAPGGLGGAHIFLAHGDRDDVIPRDLLARTWKYLTTESGADVESRLEHAGHELPAATVAALATWVAARAH